MSERTALRAALGLLHLPSSARRVRSEPLPPDIPTLLRIASGDDAAEAHASLLTDRPRSVVRDAATFYIEQVLLSPDSDSYRVLGLTPDASNQELRRNMALLLSWLHPDKNPSGDRAVFAARVTGAWNDLRSPERRATYDAVLERSHANKAVRSQKPSRTKSATKNTIKNKKNGTHLSLRAPSHHRSGRDAGLYVDEHHSMLQRGLIYLRRVLRDRSTP